MLSNPLAFNCTDLLKSAIIRDPLVIATTATVMEAACLMSDWRSPSTSTPKTPSESRPDLLQRSRSSCVWVLDHETIVGMLTESEIVRLIAQQQSLDDIQVQQVMAPCLVTLREADFTDSGTAMNWLQQHPIPHLPLLDEQDRLVGMVTPESLQALSLQIWRDYQQSDRPLQLFTNVTTCAEYETERLEKQRFLEKITESTTAILYIFDLFEQRNIYVNCQITAILGYSPTEIQDIGRNLITNLVHPDDFQRLIDQLEQCSSATDSDVLDVEYRIRHANGNWRWLKSRDRVFKRTAEGAVWQMLGTAVDITDLKQTELALQASEATLNDVLSRVSAIIVQFRLFNDRRLEYIYYSAESETLFGYSPQELVANYALWQSRVHPDDWTTQLAPKLEDFLAGRQTLVEYRFFHKDGSLRWIRGAGKSQWDATANCWIVTIVETDISDRKAIEQQLRQSEERYRVLSEISPVGIFRNDQSGLFCTYVNEKLVQIVGHPLKTCLAGNWITTIHPDDRQNISEAWQIFMDNAAIDPTTTYHETVRYLTVEGRTVWVLTQAVGERDESGQIIGYIGSLTDITDRKQAEQQLYQLNQELEVKVQERTAKLVQINEELVRATRLKDEFLANMSHELRTPLNAVLGMTEALLEGLLGGINEAQTKALQIIETSSTHLLAVINDILDVAKIESGQIDLHCTETDVAQLCNTSIVFIQHQAQQKQIQIESKLPPNLPTVWVDELRIRQALINLLNNAVKFTPAGGQITLEVTYQPLLNAHVSLPETDGLQIGGAVQIAVMDTGIGIDPADQDKLFQPFVQIDSALNRQYTGAGLGLTIAKRIVELHGGTIALTSQVGVGSCFTLRLLCLAPTWSQPQPIQPDCSHEFISSALGDPPKILLAEDNEANTQTITSYLQAKGYDVVCASDGQMAVALAQSEQPALILMDIQMPQINGIAAIQQIRLLPNVAHVPVIALTALAMAGDRDRCLAAGANTYLSKPIKLKQLSETIQQLLARVSS